MDEIDAAIDGAIHAQVDGDMEVTFEADDWDDPSSLMKVWEMGRHRAELRYLRKPDTNEPMNNPWHVKIIGPDPLAGGRVSDVWSSSYDERDSAEGAAVGKLRDLHQRHQRRQDRGQVSPHSVGDTAWTRPWAEEKADVYGCDGVHRMEDGRWMPCEDHETYKEAKDAWMNSQSVGRQIDAAIAAKCGCSKPRGDKKDEEWGQTIGADDFAVPAEECNPLLIFNIDPEGAVDTPSARLELEKDIASPAALGYTNHSVYTVTHGGPASFGNIVAVARATNTESWEALDRKVENTLEVLEDEGWVRDADRDVTVTVEGGDAEIIAREFQEGHSR